MAASLASQIDQLLFWDPAGSTIMNETLQETNQGPSTSLAVSSRVGAGTPLADFRITKEEVTAAAAVAALAIKAASSHSNTSISINKRHQSDLEESSSSRPSDLTGTAERSERNREKIARLDGHAAVPFHPYNVEKPKTSRLETQESSTSTGAVPTQQPRLLGAKVPSSAAMSPSSTEVGLRPFPYFYYRDFSKVPDPDPLTPLTAPGRVPNFPAKMHSILSRADLVDIVAWMPHGRAWRVLKPREFECRVIPTYFEHAKFSSFVRQANGWGFRRITQGKDRNAYYHEMFLRGLPHLCKMMKRPGVAEKQATDPDQEPDFYKIAEENPVPERAEDDSILLQCTLQGGPKARMPICYGAMLFSSSTAHESTNPSTAPLAPRQNVSASHHAIAPGPRTQPYHHHGPTEGSSAASPTHHDVHIKQMSVPNLQVPASVSCGHTGSKIPASSRVQPVGHNRTLIPSLTSLPLHYDPTRGGTSFASTDAASQFAAGFAAAAALSQQQLHEFLGQALGTTVPHNRSAPPSSGNTGSSSDGSSQYVLHPAPPSAPQQRHHVASHHHHFRTTVTVDGPAPVWKEPSTGASATEAKQHHLPQQQDQHNHQLQHHHQHHYLQQPSHHTHYYQAASQEYDPNHQLPASGHQHHHYQQQQQQHPIEPASPQHYNAGSHNHLAASPGPSNQYNMGEGGYHHYPQPQQHVVDHPQYPHPHPL